MSAIEVTEEASRKRREEFAAITDQITNIAMGPLKRLGKNRREAVGTSYIETAALLQPASIRADIRNALREMERFLATNMDHICAKQGVEWNDKEFRDLLPTPGWMVEKLSGHLDRINSEGESLRDALSEAGAHSSENYGIRPAIEMAMKNFTNPRNAIQSIVGNHPVQKKGRKLESAVETALSRYTDAVSALVMELGNEFEQASARIVAQIRSRD